MLTLRPSRKPGENVIYKKEKIKKKGKIPSLESVCYMQCTGKDTRAHVVAVGSAVIESISVTVTYNDISLRDRYVARRQQMGRGGCVRPLSLFYSDHRPMEWKRDRSFRALAYALGSGGTRQQVMLSRVVLGPLELDFVGAVVFLGIILDERLQWGPHINKPAKRLGSAGYLVGKIRILSDVGTARPGLGINYEIRRFFNSINPSQITPLAPCLGGHVEPPSTRGGPAQAA
ncbi:hypothetical protein EVAR_4547_1 [Eumeta japonica]|uniref:Uncharacterized protein n=1 Tax=Eumeta variegata TaxID=151549 RepID=A0A4C1SWS7_EUMVA|nr:hypothetical protein EVAR_4547_1 [Eumeta japonica]